ncbi:MAG: glycogen debranching enzyme N-terminal domain-containing protein, partial [Acetivibrionales bacterium]
MRFGKSEWSSFDRGIEREWLLTNGIGGFSSSTVIGANSRRYHGLLIASLEPPIERHLILSQLHETVVINGREISLSSFSTGNYINAGYLLQTSFELDPLPVFTYGFGDTLLEKTVSLVYGENTAVIRYRIRTGCDDAEVRVAPLVNFRDYHGDSSKYHMRFTQKPGNDHTII